MHIVASLLLLADLLVAAHRGASTVAPENTVAAFTAAGTAGADMYELDVRATKDGELVVLHDATLNRTTNVEQFFPDRAPWRVRDFTLEEIQQLDAGSWFHSSFAGQRVPTLAEAISVLHQGPTLVIEVKRPTPEMHPRLLELLSQARSSTIVQSFDWEFIRTLKTTVRRAVLGPVAKSRLRYVASFADYINVPHRMITPTYVRAAHRRGLKVTAYTVDEPKLMRRMRAAGVDCLLTNQLRTARRVADMKPPALSKFRRGKKNKHKKARHHTKRHRAKHRRR